MFSKHSVIIIAVSILIFSQTYFAQSQSWTQITTTGSSPTTRSFATVVYDTTNNLMIIFGGVNFSGFNDVWVLSHANGLGGTSVWTQITTTGSSPEARYQHSAIYDGINNRMTIFGGYAGHSLNDVWVLSHANGLGGTPTWTEITTTGSSPTTRDSHTAIYDAANNSMTVFGGEDNSGTRLNEVWVLSTANGLGTSAWTQVTATGSSQIPRLGHSAIYDSNHNIMTIFGGFSDTGYVNDVWVLSTANGLGTSAWTQLSPTGSTPTSRNFSSAIYDSTQNRMTLFGGRNGGTFLNDIWVLTHANGQGGTSAWTQLSPTGSAPTTRVGTAAVYDSVNNRMTIFGGNNSGTLLNDVWVLDNADVVPVKDWKIYSFNHDNSFLHFK